MASPSMGGVPREIHSLICSFLPLSTVYLVGKCNRRQRSFVNHLPPSFYPSITIPRCPGLDSKLPLLRLRPRTLRIAMDPSVRAVDLEALEPMASSLTSLTLRTVAISPMEPRESADEKEIGWEDEEAVLPKQFIWLINSLSELTNLTSLTIFGSAWGVAAAIGTLSRLTTLHLTDAHSHDDLAPKFDPEDEQRARRSPVILAKSLTSLHYGCDDRQEVHQIALQLSSLRHLAMPRTTFGNDITTEVACRLQQLESLHVHQLSLLPNDEVRRVAARPTRAGRPARAPAPPPGPLYPHLTSLTCGFYHDGPTPFQSLRRLCVDMPSLVSLSLLELDLGGGSDDDDEDHEDNTITDHRRQLIDARLRSMVDFIRRSPMVSSLRSLKIECGDFSSEFVTALLRPPSSSSSASSSESESLFRLTSLDLAIPDAPPFPSLCSLPTLTHLRGLPDLSGSVMSSSHASSSSSVRALSLPSLLSLEVLQPPDEWPSSSMMAIHFPNLTSLRLPALEPSHLESIIWPIIAAFTQLRLLDIAGQHDLTLDHLVALIAVSPTTQRLLRFCCPACFADAGFVVNE